MDKFLRYIADSLFPSDPGSGQFGSIEYNLFFARLMGIPLFGYTAKSKCFKTFIWANSVLTIIVFSIIYLAFEIYDLILCWGDINKFTQNACLTMTHVGGALKLCNLLMRYGEVNEMLNKLKIITQKYCILKTQIIEFNRGEFLNKCFLTLYLSLVGLTAFAGIAVLINEPERYMELLFPFRIKLPDCLPTKLKIIYMSLGVSILAWQVVLMDYLHINVINQIRFQLRILNISLKGITNVKTAEDSLRTQVQHHIEILSLRDCVEDIFNFPLLVQFFTSMTIFALTGFQATVRTDVSGAMITYLYCGCIFSELFIYCWFGNEVIEQNKTLSEMGYNSPWYTFSRKYKKSLLLFLMNAQRPFVFTAGGFINLSLSTFSTVLSRSYSYIALLIQLNGTK